MFHHLSLRTLVIIGVYLSIMVAGLAKTMAWHASSFRTDPIRVSHYSMDMPSSKITETGTVGLAGYQRTRVINLLLLE